jgi:pimeloyl-ACP methyl ester carboxylesterase
MALHYREQGNGPTVIFLHGFPMNMHVWNGFTEKLSQSFHVVTPDLPGFGKSPALQEGFTIDDVAEAIHTWMLEKSYTQPVIVGHSLGGYVTLALAGQQPMSIAGMCLFHSTALADSSEKKQSRNKVLEFIEKQGVHAFTSSFISQLYADPQHSSIIAVKKIAVESTKEIVTGYTCAMRDRKDRTDVVKSFSRPILLIAGEKDQGIPPDTILQQASLNSNAEAFILPEVAHMGMFEAPEACVKKIQKFLEKCLVTF